MEQVPEAAALEDLDLNTREQGVLGVVFVHCFSSGLQGTYVLAVLLVDAMVQ